MTKKHEAKLERVAKQKPRPHERAKLQAAAEKKATAKRIRAAANMAEATTGDDAATVTPVALAVLAALASSSQESLALASPKITPTEVQTASPKRAPSIAPPLPEHVDSLPPPPRPPTFSPGECKAEPAAGEPSGDAAPVSFDSTPAAPTRPLSLPPPAAEGTAAEYFSPTFFRERWGTEALRGNAELDDEFGLDRTYEKHAKPFTDFLYDRYFRVAASGFERIPKAGRIVLVANHAGTIPLDGLLLRMAFARECSRELRFLVEDDTFYAPFIGTTLNRLGAVRACQENAERLLANDTPIAVFPEGLKGTEKLYRDRYKLQRFGRGGFVKLALRTSAKIVPVSIVGSEECNPLLLRVPFFAKALGLPHIPVTPTFPLLGPLGLLPAPVKWMIRIGEPVDLSEHSAKEADDEVLVAHLAEGIRATIHETLGELLRSRRSLIRG